MSSVYVYRYGLSHPITNLDLVYDQLRAAHRYRNTLVEIERGRRAAVRQILSEQQPILFALSEAVKAADAAVLDAFVAIKRQRAKTRKRSEAAEDRLRLKEARAVKWLAVNKLRDARAALRDDADLTAAIQTINDRASELGCGARALTPSYWGSYLLVEDEMQASAKMPLYGDDGITPNDPRFVPWTGEGALGVQLQGGKGVADILRGKSRLIRMTPDERAYLRRTCDRRRVKDKAGLLEMRVNSDEKGHPIWAQWHLDMHRLLPENGVVKGAAVHVRKVAHKTEWSLTVTVEHTRPSLPMNDKTIAIDIGWRVMGDELRVAGWKDSDGNEGEVRLAAKDIRLLRRPEDLRSERDSYFGIAKMRLLKYLTADAAPEWLAEEAATLERWNSADRLSRLFDRWRGLRGDGAVERAAYNELEAWCWKDRHVALSEASMRQTALARRKSFYRETAARFAQTYGTIVVERFDLRDVAKRSEDVENETARSNRQLAAVSELRGAIVHAAASRGRLVPAVSAVNTTRICPSCGVVEDRDAAASVVLTCECGAVWDQDIEGAPAELLRRWRERPGDAKMLAGARVDGTSQEDGAKESRYGKRTRAKREKKSREGGARETTADGAE